MDSHITSKVPNPNDPEDESVVLVSERPGPKRLRRAEGQAGNDQPRKPKRKDTAQLAMFLDTAAVNSDNEDTASDTDEDIEPETWVSCLLYVDIVVHQKYIADG